MRWMGLPSDAQPNRRESVTPRRRHSTCQHSDKLMDQGGFGSIDLPTRLITSIQGRRATNLWSAKDSSQRAGPSTQTHRNP